MLYVVCETPEDPVIDSVGYAMEWMAHSADDQHNYTLQQLLNVFEQIASALTFSHENRIVHRDVKPGNIMLDDTRSVAKLCDFGLASLFGSLPLSDVSTSTSSLHRGTLLYMAPEIMSIRVDQAGIDLFWL